MLQLPKGKTPSNFWKESLMALEIFGLLTNDGDVAQSDHLFMGKASDIEAVAVVLNEIFAGNKRLRSVAALAKRFHDGAGLTTPLVRLNKNECRLLADTLDAHAADSPKRTKARKLRDHFCNALCVF